MPNWCSNNLQITGTKEQIALLNKKLDECKGKSFFDIFGIPDAEAAGAGDDWYVYNLENYGCKWNCDAHVWDVDGDGTNLSISFDSPWGPPNKLFEGLTEEYTEVLAYYYEPGMAFCGRFQDGDDETYDIPGTVQEAMDTIPSDIDDFFNISEQIADREEEAAEDEDS
jgi:hypothetical protein